MIVLPFTSALFILFFFFFFFDDEKMWVPFDVATQRLQIQGNLQPRKHKNGYGELVLHTCGELLIYSFLLFYSSRVVTEYI